VNGENGRSCTLGEVLCILRVPAVSGTAAGAGGTTPQYITCVREGVRYVAALLRTGEGAFRTFWHLCGLATPQSPSQRCCVFRDFSSFAFDALSVLPACRATASLSWRGVTASADTAAAAAWRAYHAGFSPLATVAARRGRLSSMAGTALSLWYRLSRLLPNVPHGFGAVAPMSAILLRCGGRRGMCACAAALLRGFFITCLLSQSPPGGGGTLRAALLATGHCFATSQQATSGGVASLGRAGWRMAWRSRAQMARRTPGRCGDVAVSGVCLSPVAGHVGGRLRLYRFFPVTPVVVPAGDGRTEGRGSSVDVWRAARLWNVGRTFFGADISVGGGGRVSSHGGERTCTALPGGCHTSAPLGLCARILPFGAGAAHFSSRSYPPPVWPLLWPLLRSVPSRITTCSSSTSLVLQNAVRAWRHAFLFWAGNAGWREWIPHGGTWMDLRTPVPSAQTGALAPPLPPPTPCLRLLPHGLRMPAAAALAAWRRAARCSCRNRHVLCLRLYCSLLSNTYRSVIPFHCRATSSSMLPAYFFTTRIWWLASASRCAARARYAANGDRLPPRMGRRAG
jgi:hypothetical protein